MLADPIAERVLHHLREVGMSKSAFSEKTGVNKASLSHLENGRNKASLSLIEAFHTVFPDVDLHWLLTGEKREASLKSVPESTPAPAPTSEETKKITTSDSKKEDFSLKKENEDKERNQNSSNNSQTLTVLYSDGTYLEYKSRI